jgi:hypothetical protein
VDAGEPAWSQAVEHSDWIGGRLAPFGSAVSSVVPGGFEAYARILHPAEDLCTGGRVVRWAAVAAWSGMPLRRDVQFHSIALPPRALPEPAPSSGQGPRRGTLYLPDAEVVAATARAWTSTPELCWFCVWDGYGWGDAPRLLSWPDGTPELNLAPESRPESATAPGAVGHEALVHLPHRDYLLYSGPVEQVAAPARLSGTEQTANLWWPDDRAWCVASEIDLAWTYVGGPAGLIGRLLADERIEALPAAPDDPFTRVEDWVTAWVTAATAELLSAGVASIATSRGTVRARLHRNLADHGATLHTESAGDNGISSGTHVLRGRGDEELRRDVACYLTSDVIDLVGG